MRFEHGSYSARCNDQATGQQNQHEEKVADLRAKKKDGED